MIFIILYLSGIVLANLLVHWFGLVRFAGLVFPAGAVMVGLTFSFRDMVQRRYGKWQCWIWMLAASVITYLFNQQLAVASVSAFLIAETVDWAIYTWIPGSFRKRLVMSNLLGTPLDSLVFVALAFGLNWQAIIGQTIVKFISSLAVLLLPFGAVIFALALDDWVRNAQPGFLPAARRVLLVACIAATAVTGFRESVSTVSEGVYIPEEVNGRAGEVIPDGSGCLAPMHFVFGQVHRLRVGSIYLWRTMSDAGELRISDLLEYAADRDTRYIVLDAYWMDRIEDCSAFLGSQPEGTRVTDTGDLVVLEAVSPGW